MKSRKVAGNSPIIEKLESGKTYAWCSCGHSTNQPWCNGAHQGTAHTPSIYKCEETSSAAICMCKLTSNPPYCDGSHNKLN